MKEDLRRYKIEYDEWFLESTLHNSGYVAETVELLAGKGWTYEKDGALWLNTTALLKQKFLAEGKSQEQVDKLELKDDVLRRANGFYTYFAADIAYHRNKLEQRGFSKAINIWGADHHGHVARLQAALDGLGLDGSHRLIIVLMQLVNLLQDGQPVRMSKRSGKAIALRDLLDEVSVDAARFFFNSRSSIGGPTRKTVVAAGGTVAGVVIAGLAATLFSLATGITGWNVSDIESLLTLASTSGIQVGGLLFSGLLISSLGAVMDVAMSIASAIAEIHVQNPALSRRALFRAGMHVGRDMMGTDSNTLILAFAGGSISMLVLDYAYNLPYRQIINSNNIGIAIMQGLFGSFGIVLAVPVTVALAVLLYTWRKAAPAA